MPAFVGPKQKQLLLLVVLLLSGGFLRFYRLGLESFWLDELYTVTEADPSWSLARLFDTLKCCDQHPPLFYLCERLVFMILGRSEWTARLFPALAGLAGIWAMYRFGREVADEKLGLIAATLTCFNFFHIYFSREARSYSLLFLLATLSFIYLFRTIRHLRPRDLALYTFFALLTLYTHYFGIFLVGAQFVAAAVMLFRMKDKARYARAFLISGVFLAAAYAVWIPYLLQVHQIKSFWIEPVRGGFFVDYFQNYFGNAVIVEIVAGVLIIVCLIAAVARKPLIRPPLFPEGYRLSLGILFVSLFFFYLLPYIRSVLFIPSMIPRYTIPALPALLIIIAYGMAILQKAWLQYLLLAVIIGVSMVNIVRDKRMYTGPTKTQFRELTAFMADNDGGRRYPILNERTPGLQSYYIEQLHCMGRVYPGLSATVIDSFIHRTSPQYAVEAFWLVEIPIHPTGELFLVDGIRAGLDSVFVVESQRDFLDGKIKLYRRRSY